MIRFASFVVVLNFIVHSTFASDIYSKSEVFKDAEIAVKATTDLYKYGNTLVVKEGKYVRLRYDVYTLESFCKQKGYSKVAFVATSRRGSDGRSISDVAVITLDGDTVMAPHTSSEDKVVYGIVCANP